MTPVRRSFDNSFQSQGAEVGSGKELPSAWGRIGADAGPIGSFLASAFKGANLPDLDLHARSARGGVRVYLDGSVTTPRPRRPSRNARLRYQSCLPSSYLPHFTSTSDDAIDTATWPRRLRTPFFAPRVGLLLNTWSACIVADWCYLPPWDTSASLIYLEGIIVIDSLDFRSPGPRSDNYLLQCSSRAATHGG